MNKKGFTLLETLFALVIVSTGFFSVFSLAQTGIRATNASINRLIAANLAQEGVEIIRNIRDSVYVAGDDWNAVANPGHLDKHNCLTNHKNCRISIEPGSNQLLDEDNSAYLKIDANGKYSYSSGDNSIFRRWVNLTQGGGICNQIATSTDCIEIDVTISWQEKGRNQDLEVEDYIYNWY